MREYVGTDFVVAIQAGFRIFLQKSGETKNMYLFTSIRYAVFVFFLSSSVFAHQFSVMPPEFWHLQSQDGDTAIYKNMRSFTNERIILQSIKTNKNDVIVARQMTRDKLRRARAAFMETFGLAEYTVMNVSSEPTKDGRFKDFVIVESNYRDIAGRFVQMLEWQYFGHGKMFVVTYLVDVRSPDDFDPATAAKIMNRFRPASGISGQSMLEDAPEKIKLATTAWMDRIWQFWTGPAQAVENIEHPGSDPETNGTSKAPTAALNEKQLSTDEIEKYCSDVPAERRRKPTDHSFASQIKTTLETPKNCILGIADNVWDIVKSAWNAAKSGIKYVFDSSYRTQVNATVGVIASEIYKDPVGFAKKVVAEMWTATAREVGQFFSCLKPGEQTRAFCNLATNLVPAGLMGKIITKSLTGVDDVATFAKLAKKSIGFEKPESKKVVATAAKESNAEQVVTKASAKPDEQPSIPTAHSPSPASSTSSTTKGPKVQQSQPTVPPKVSERPDANQNTYRGRTTSSSENPLRFKLQEKTGNAETDEFRSHYLKNDLKGDAKYISVEDSRGERRPAQVLEMKSDGSLKVRIQNRAGDIVEETLHAEQLLSGRLSERSKALFDSSAAKKDITETSKKNASFENPGELTSTSSNVVKQKPSATSSKPNIADNDQLQKFADLLGDAPPRTPEQKRMRDYVSAVEKARANARASGLGIIERTAEKNLDELGIELQAASRQELREYAEKSGYKDIVKRIDDGDSNDSIVGNILNKEEVNYFERRTIAGGGKHTFGIMAAPNKVSTQARTNVFKTWERFQEVQARVEKVRNGAGISVSLQDEYNSAREALDKARQKLSKEVLNDSVAKLIYERKVQPIEDPRVEIAKINEKYKSSPPFGERLRGGFKTRKSIEICQVAKPDRTPGKYFFPCDFAIYVREPWFQDGLASYGFRKEDFASLPFVRFKVPPGKVILVGETNPLRDPANFQSLKQVIEDGRPKAVGGNGNLLQLFIQDLDGVEALP